MFFPDHGPRGGVDPPKWSTIKNLLVDQGTVDSTFHPSAQTVLAGD